MKAKIAVLRGDGIGPEVTDAAVMVLGAVAEKRGHEFEFSFPLIGGSAIDNTGVPLPQDTLDICKASDAILLGAVGGNKWDSRPVHLRPERGLLGLRSALELFINIRPVLLYDELKYASPIKNEYLKQGIDFIIVRELAGGMYFGESGRKVTERGQEAYDIENYSVMEIERIANVAFEIARNRGKKVTSIDKANVLESSRLWRATVEHVAKKYPDVALEHMYVDNCAMQIVRNPSQFDVMLCSNMFGDILSDEAAAVTGSIGMLPSSSLGTSKRGLYEPIHGSAPDIAGLDAANPLATILAAAMMLSNSLDLHSEAHEIQESVKQILKSGYRTPDIFTAGTKKIGCMRMGELVAMQILNNK